MPQGQPRPLQSARDSLELASLASSSPSARPSVSSSTSGPPSSRKLSFDDDDDPLHAQNTSERARLHERSFSVSSAFDFAPAVFPLSTTNGGYASLGGTSSHDPATSGQGASLERHKSLTYTNGLSLVVGMIIGSGIFSSPSQVNTNAGSPGFSLIVWALAGILTWTGAASYAELGGAIPLNGGAQVYLAKIFGEAAGFLYCWCAVCVLKPGSAAIIAIIFGEYLVRAVIGADAIDASPLINKGVALAGLALVTGLNAVSTKVAALSANAFMFFKFAALLGVTVIGIVVAVTGLSWNGNPSNDWKTQNWFSGTNSDLSQLAVALYAGLWAFDGWDNINYVTGELVNPTRDLPRIIHSSLPIVIVAYLLANTAYFLVLPLSVTYSSTTIAVQFGSQVLGPIGSLVLALVVAGSCFGALNATTFTSSRLSYAAAKEGYLPAFIGTLGVRGHDAARLPAQATPNTQRRGLSGMLRRFFGEESSGLFLTPIPALLMNFLLTAVYVALGTFRTLITFYGVAGYFFYFLTVLGLLVLRVKEPHLERPYKCWITTPVIFCCVSLFLLSRSIVAEPWTTFSMVIFVIVGLAVYYVRIRRGSKQARGSWWKFWGLSA